RSAPQAVPVPQETAAPVTKESESGSGTSVDTGTFIYFAWAPWPPEPQTTGPSRHICVQPARQCLQLPQPSYVHHALADPGFPVGGGGAHCRDHAAGLVTGDHAGRALDATRDDSTRIGWGAVVVQVAAAHARGLDLEDHVARAGCRIGELSELQLAISQKHDAFHAPPPVRDVRRGTTKRIALDRPALMRDTVRRRGPAEADRKKDLAAPLAAV